MIYETYAMCDKMLGFQKRMDIFTDRLNDFQKIICRDGEIEMEREERDGEVIGRIEEQLDVILERMRLLDCFVEKMSIKLQMMNPDIDALD